MSLNVDRYSSFEYINLSFFAWMINSSFALWLLNWLSSQVSSWHFELESISGRVAYIFNSTRLDSTENWVNSTRFVKNLSLMSRELNIEIFPVFCFCIIFLHYLFDRKLWRKTWWETWRKTWRETWRLFDRRSWRKT